jgi:Prp8 binding protein
MPRRTKPDIKNTSGPRKSGSGVASTEAINEETSVESSIADTRARKRHRAPSSPDDLATKKRKEITISNATISPTSTSLSFPALPKYPSSTMALEGHSAAVLSLDFEPTTGTQLLSAGMDKSAFVWNVSDGCKNTMVLEGHKNAVLQCCWSAAGDSLLTASADKMVGVWDANNGKRIRKFKGHASHVNAVSRTGSRYSEVLGAHTFATCGNDCAINIWDRRVFRCALSLKHKYPLTSVTFSSNGVRCFVGGVDETVQEWDMRKSSVIGQYQHYGGTITGLAVSPDDSYLLSNGMDGRLLCWDICNAMAQRTPYKTFLGAQPGLHDHSLLRCHWSGDNSKVCAGSNDGCGFIWDFATCDLIDRLGGHRGCVNDVVFHPFDSSLVATAANDSMVICGQQE